MSNTGENFTFLLSSILYYETDQVGSTGNASVFYSGGDEFESKRLADYINRRFS
jgi:hypothetical protein